MKFKVIPSGEIRFDFTPPAGMRLASVDVYFDAPEEAKINLAEPWAGFCINATPQEAFTLMSLPCMAGLISHIEPNYELSEMPEEGK